MKYANAVMGWLQDLGYTHCFFVAGGNSMHLLDGARQTMTCVPFVHEVGAGIAAEYFNETGGEGRAFVLVTAGPGLTNIVTAIGGAFLESRELLVLGGQVKSSDLATGGIRQRGIQEIDGRSIVEPICKRAVRVESPLDRAGFESLVLEGRSGRPGPVFIEMCLDVQAAPYTDLDAGRSPLHAAPMATVDESVVESIRALLAKAQRPVLLLGGGIPRGHAGAVLAAAEAAGIGVMTTWNGADRVPSDHPLDLGRPNTWGQRSANIVLSQADLILAAGTRLGLQQTGFNWQSFGEHAVVVHVDVDEAELRKGHPRVDIAGCGDATDAILRCLPAHPAPPWVDWIEHARAVREALPLSEPANSSHEGCLNPYDFVLELSEQAGDDDVIVPCSSGGAFTVMMQAFLQRRAQVVITDKGSASMGYGLAGAIGASLALPGRRTVLVEGDGGFAENLQELAIVSAHELPLKIVLFDNDGYASIRMTQRNYFNGAYLGCDTQTGLAFPNWIRLFGAFSIPVVVLGAGFATSEEFQSLWGSQGPAAFIVPIHPEQTFFPKITSRVTASGGMESNPLHLMDPPLDGSLWSTIHNPQFKGARSEQD